MPSQTFLVSASCHGNCREISGEILLFLSPQEAKLEVPGVFHDKFHATFKGRRTSININFLVRISRGRSDPYARMPGGQKVSPHHRGRKKTHFLVRMSMIFGADVHGPKGSQKVCTKNICVDFLAPNFSPDS